MFACDSFRDLDFAIGEHLKVGAGQNVFTDIVILMC
jgi:hypothetical protein